MNKTSKTVTKRFKIKKSGKIKYWHSNWNHYKIGKSSNWKRKIRKGAHIDKKGLRDILEGSLIR